MQTIISVLSRLKCQLLVLLATLMASVSFSTAVAATPTMNQAFEATDFQFTAWGNVAIPASYFLSNAVEIQVTVKGAVYVAFQVNDTDYNVYAWNDANAAGITYTLDETSRAAALAGTLKVRVNKNDATLTILNKDANYQEPSLGDGGSGDGGSGDGGSGDGGTTSTTFTGDKQGGYTIDDLKGQYGGVDSDKLSLIISKKRQITNLPTVYLTVPDALNADGTAMDINTVLYKNTSTGEALYHSASIKVVDDSHPDLCFEDEKLEIKVRGNETALGTKKPYRLKFGKDKKDAAGNVIETHKHDMLGYGYSKRNWTLIANQKDPSYAHNALSYHIGQAVGMDFCPGYRFVDLVINGVYRGCYMISDHVEVGSNRIELEDEDTGWYLESNRDNQVEEPYVSSENCGGIYVSIKNPEPATDAETASLKSEVSAYFTAIKAIMDQKTDASVFCDPENGWRKYFDEEALVKYYVGTNLTGNHDGFMTVKMSRNAGQKVKVGPLWDHDTAFGIYDDGKTLSEDAQSSAPLFCNYAQAIAQNDPVFIKKVHDLLHQVLNANYQTNILQNIDDITASVNTSQYLEAPWGNDYQTQITKLKTYVTAHNAWLTTTIDKMYTDAGGDNIVDNTGGGETPATRKQLTDVPTIYLDATVGTDWSAASLEVFDKDNKLTQGTAWTSAAVWVQYQGGHSEGTKDSYRLKFDSKTKLLASGKFKQWVLASNDDDPSLINNALAKELGDLVGMPFTPGYQFVDLYVNNTYMGTYQVTDRIKTESGRALVTGGNKDNDWHVRINDNDEIAEGEYADTKYIAATTTMPNLVIKNPDPDDLDATTLATLKSDMNTWFATFFGKTNGHYSSVADNVDKQQIINWYICQEVLAIYKGLSSVEAYRSITATDQTLHFGPLWDNETAFGNRGDEDAALSMSDLNTADSYNGLIFKYNKYGVMKSFIEDLWTQDWFKTGVLAKWNALVEAGLLSTLKSKASTISATLEQSQQKNAEKWPNSLKTKYKNYSSYSAAVAAIGTYLDQRVPYLTKKFTALGTTSAGDVNVDGKIDKDDVSALGDYIINNYTGNFSESAADVNGDGKISIADVSALIKMLQDLNK